MSESSNTCTLQKNDVLRASKQVELLNERSTAPAMVPTAISGAVGQKADVLHRGTTLIAHASSEADAISGNQQSEPIRDSYVSVCRGDRRSQYV